MDTITYRPATIDDAAFIASAVLAGVGYEYWDGKAMSDDIPINYERMRDLICTAENMLYSYRNAVLAECEGRIAACMISYNGDNYLEYRENVSTAMGWDSVPEEFGTEVEPGEYYLDTLAAHPDFRGRGIGAGLLKKTAEDHKDENPCLIVETGHDKVIELYESLGFCKTDIHVSLFGTDYMKMYYRPDGRK